MPPVRIGLRRATLEDQKAVTGLITRAGGSSKFRKRYGTFNAAFLEASYLSVIAFNADDPSAPLLGFAAFSDGPREGVSLEEWLGAANELLGQTWRPASLLFLTFLVADPTPMHEHRVVEQLMARAFATLPLTSFVVATLPAREEVPSDCGRHFRSLTAGYGEAGVELPGGAAGGAKGGEQVLLCERELVLPTLAVRRAVVEDHDDLAPVMAAQAAPLREAYGDFFLAELIEAQDAASPALVGEADGRVVGLMGLSAEVDAEALGTCFNLRPFGHFERGARRRRLKPTPRPPSRAATDAADGEAKEGVEAKGDGDAVAAAEVGAEVDLDVGDPEAKEEEKGEEKAETKTDAGTEEKGGPEEEVEGEVFSNAFSVTLFCLDGKFESRAADFLPHAFR